jgi:hypothetical protein
MESLLIVVAAVSLALAAIMSTVAWRLLRDTKVRTRDRAEALVALLHGGEKPAPRPAADPTWTPATAVKTPSTGGPDQHAHPDGPGESIANVRQGEHSTPVAALLPLTDSESDSALATELVPPRATPGAEAQPAASSKTDVRPKAGAQPSSPIADTPLRAAPIRQLEDESAIDAWDRTNVGRGLNRTSPVEPSLADAMFAADEPRQMSIGRWVGLAAAALVILIGAGTVYALNSGTWLSSVTGSWDRTFRAAASTQPPLELLSLRHTTDETGAFVVTGLVQNPAEGETMKGVVATVYLFDQQGRYFANGRARLDVPALGPGEESPFVVKIPQTAGVGRYRVGFRLDDGGVVAHVDRRGQTPAGTSGDTTDDSGGSVATPAATPRRSEG